VRGQILSLRRIRGAEVETSHERANENQS
jgi:hypothetical protein